MNAVKHTLAVAAVALLASAAVSAETVARNFTASSNYWAWVNNMNTPADLSMPKQADVGRTSPLHPAFYGANIDDTKWVGTKASAEPAGEIRNPLHPKFYQR